jgi:hypothetical protein
MKAAVLLLLSACATTPAARHERRLNQMCVDLCEADPRAEGRLTLARFRDPDVCVCWAVERNRSASWEIEIPPAEPDVRVFASRAP